MTLEYRAQPPHCTFHKVCYIHNSDLCEMNRMFENKTTDRHTFENNYSYASVLGYLFQYSNAGWHNIIKCCVVHCGVNALARSRHRTQDIGWMNIEYAVDLDPNWDRDFHIIYKYINLHIYLIACIFVYIKIHVMHILKSAKWLHSTSSYAVGDTRISHFARGLKRQFSWLRRGQK